jgi:hypothetical protein
VTDDTKGKILVVVLILAVAWAGAFAYSHLHHSSPPVETSQEKAMLAGYEQTVCQDLGNVGSYSEWFNEANAPPSANFLRAATEAANAYENVEKTVTLPNGGIWDPLVSVIADNNGMNGNVPPLFQWGDLHDLEVSCVKGGFS